MSPVINFPTLPRLDISCNMISTALYKFGTISTLRFLNVSGNSISSDVIEAFCRDATCSLELMDIYKNNLCLAGIARAINYFSTCSSI